MDNFIPVLRFAVVSDIHYEDAPTVERERFEKAVCSAYAIAEGSAQYNKLDALYVVGDFATSGSEIQMNAFSESAKKTLRNGTILTLTMASHEFNERNGGEAAALEKFGRIFGMQPDTHKIINGFHFIAVTTTRGCHFSDEKKAWISEQLQIAAADDAKKPIFFFQHPHISGTVYGSANWGEDEITPILMNYPQIIDFSGHSHAPINDPRSIHQRHFTCLGTGTLSYFELDEFDKIYGTCPPNDNNAAQMLIVEADEAGRVRVYPYDVLTGNFFPCTWKIDTPWDTDSFIYT
ncbi:MAG: metallophosphoesterase, partial [Clostridiales bacterium]|nr:metallophosphoesterase [Clostridiales bacterium]